jgi:endonuclease YncB( thermonuclease family)
MTGPKALARLIGVQPRAARHGVPSPRWRYLVPCAVTLLLFVIAPASLGASAQATYRVDHVVDGDTIRLRNGQSVRLVQIDTPEVFFGTECYGRQASATAKRLLPEGTRVRLLPEPATDRIDGFGRLLRYVVRASDGVNVNLGLVAVGAAAPYFFEGRRGRFASKLELLAKSAKNKNLGLWGACPRTHYDPYSAIETRR